MNILVLGGTGFLGRHITQTLLDRHHQVTVFARGHTRALPPAGVEVLTGDRELGLQGLQALQGRSWDACVDCSGYTAVQVQASTELLKNLVQHYVYLSAVSVYGDPAHGPVTEDFPLVEPAPAHITEVDGSTYGPLKVTCEQVVRKAFQHHTVLRPQVVTGPFDPSGRYSHWVNRARAGGEMLCPGDGTDFLQVVDVRDVAAFVVHVLEMQVSGTFNLSGPRFTWGEFVRMLGVEHPVWVPSALLKEAGLTFVELPLYRPHGGPRSSLMHVDHQRASNAGFKVTPAEVTLRDMQLWSMQHPEPLAMPADLEQRLLRQSKGME
ncbi:NAD-dependent epimerase/dehydratase family protein [Deinococcus misasensis]|uniref:NAD-dependent epimerase/dehydratase family protein n=1 Tax=Deinococcus misasensis TaxID=392413 RepID=UPI000557D1DF|nr:NAD-dependent epimerase/dehydratase family protein [Deinococcus misasensis]